MHSEPPSAHWRTGCEWPLLAVTGRCGGRATGDSRALLLWGGSTNGSPVGQARLALPAAATERRCHYPPHTAATGGWSGVDAGDSPQPCHMNVSLGLAPPPRCAPRYPRQGRSGHPSPPYLPRLVLLCVGEVLQVGGCGTGPLHTHSCWGCRPCDSDSPLTKWVRAMSGPCCPAPWGLCAEVRQSGLLGFFFNGFSSPINLPVTSLLSAVLGRLPCPALPLPLHECILRPWGVGWPSHSLPFIPREIFFFFFCTKVAPGSVLGDQTGLGGGGVGPPPASPWFQQC